MRSLVFAMNNGDVGGAESGLAEKVEQFDLGEAQPYVGVKFPGFFKVVTQQVEDDNAAAGPENAGSFVNGFLRVQGVMETLTEQGNVDGSVGQGQFFEIAEFKLHIFDAAAAGGAGGVLDHFFRIVDAGDLFGALGKEERECPFAGTDVGNAHGRK